MILIETRPRNSGDMFDIDLDFLAWETDVRGVGHETFAFTRVTFDEARPVEDFVEAADAEADAEIAGEEELGAAWAIVGVTTESKHGFHHVRGKRLGIRFRPARTILKGLGIEAGDFVTIPPFIIGFSADSEI